MKKMMMVLAVWFIVAVSLIYGKAHTALEFEICYDSKTEATYPLKEEIEMKYAELVEGIHEESYLAMLRSNLSQFQIQDNLQISFDQRLRIVEGDGKGEVIRGQLEAYQICMPKVEPQSLLSDLNGWLFP